MARLLMPSFIANCFLLFMMSSFFHQFSVGEVAIASVYNPPYTPTLCYGDSTSNLPTNNLFAAAAGEGIWDNGAARGRQYSVRCISAAAVQNTCIPSQTIEVTIIDRAQTSVSRPARRGVAIVLSNMSFGIIAKPPATSIVVDIQPQP